MESQGSNFVRPAGLIFLSVLLLVSACLKIPALETFLAAVLILCLGAYLWARYALNKIDVAIENEDCCAFPGEVFEVEAELCNRKLLPLVWLDVHFPVGDCTCAAPICGVDGEKPATIGASFHWVMPYQRLDFIQRAEAVHRGVCKVPSVRLESGDGYGLTVSKRDAPLPAAFRFVVYPRIIPVEASPILHNISEMERDRTGFYIDNTLLESTRDYHDGDSFKDINWRLLARGGGVQINVHEKMAMRRVCFLPDVQSYCYRAIEEKGSEKIEVVRVDAGKMEKMFSLMASLIVKLHEKGVFCSVVVPAIGSETAKLIIPEVREMQVMQLLTALAEIRYSGEQTAFPAAEITANHHILGQMFLFSQSIKNISCGTFLQQLEEYSIFRVVSEAPDEELRSAAHIFEETDFTAI